jgi:hypothetical protein
LSSNFPLHAWWGKFRRQKRTSLPLIGELYLIENHRHNYGQYLTTPSRTHSNFEQPLCQLLFPNLEHFNCGRKFRLCACLKRQWTRICVSARAYIWKVFVPTPRKNVCACTKLWKYGGEFEYQFLKQKHAY